MKFNEANKLKLLSVNTVETLNLRSVFFNNALICKTPKWNVTTDDTSNDLIVWAF